MEEEMMSPTTRLAQQDVMSPLEDLELDGMDVGMMSEDETLKTTTPGMHKLFQYSQPFTISFLVDLLDL